MDKKIEIIKEWLGAGSINIFGLPFSGKDTVGIRLAETLGSKFLSSGLILRAAAEADEDLRHEMANGTLANTDKFKNIVLPYFAKSELAPYSLILSSVGRWEGEEYDVIDKTANAGHPIKCVILLNVSETEAKNRWIASQNDTSRGVREDDKGDEATFSNRIAEFIGKTMPVIKTYQMRKLLVSVQGNADRETVFNNTIDGIVKFIEEQKNAREIPMTEA